MEIRGADQFRFKWKKQWSNLSAWKTWALGDKGVAELYLMYADERILVDVYIDGYEVSLEGTKHSLNSILPDLRGVPLSQALGFLTPVKMALRSDLQRAASLTTGQVDQIIKAMCKEAHAYNNYQAVDLEIRITL